MMQNLSEIHVACCKQQGPVFRLVEFKIPY